MIKFGTLLKPVGLQGELKMFSDSDFIEVRLVKGQTFIVDGQKLTISKASSVGHVHKVKFKEINSIEEAQKLRQKDVYLEQLDEKDLLEDEYYHSQLLGCTVVSNDEVLGEVIEVLDYSVHPILKVKSDSHEFMIPFVKAFVNEVNVESKTIEVTLIEGLYEN